MSPNGRQKMTLAMDRKEGPVPVMSQFAIGHILLNTGVAAVDYQFTNAGYVRGVCGIRERYHMDGILLHKPGRDESVLARTTREETPEATTLRYADGGSILLPPNEDPQYHAPEGWRFPSLAPNKSADALEDFKNHVDLDYPLAHLPQSYLDWSLHKGLVFYDKDEFPDFFFAAIDGVIDATEHAVSVHGEIKAPHDYLLNMLGLEPAMMAMLLEPELCHAILEKATTACIAWAVAQTARGCDAIKVSSPYAGNRFISRDFYLEYVLPYEKRIAAAVRTAGGRTYTHTCGSIGDRLALMADAGVDGIEAMDPPPLGDTRLADAKREIGDRVFLKGNIDSVNVLLKGSPDDVRRAARECLDAAAPGGGYILSSACSVAPAVPPKNIEAMVETAAKY